MKKKLIIVIVATIAVLILAFGARTIFTSAKQENEDTFTEKTCYEVYVIQPGDTLWTIASANASRMHVSTKAYLQELKEANGLRNDHIKAGGKLILPYAIYEVAASGNTPE